jgi:hypothetical protein
MTGPKIATSTVSAELTRIGYYVMVQGLLTVGSTTIRVFSKLKINSLESINMHKLTLSIY